jgi:predicted DNA-binding WGR domain protein
MEEIRLQRIDEDKNMKRFYIIRKDWQLSLFGGKTITLVHGRIGRWSVQKTLCLGDEAYSQFYLDSIVKTRKNHRYTEECI